MQTPLTELSEAIQQKAKVCETIAQDKTQESLTGPSNEKEANEAEAKVWQQKSDNLREAAAIVSAGSVDQAAPIPKRIMPPALPE